MDTDVRLSIVIPIYEMQNAEELLTRCLDSLVDQSFSDFDVIVTDNSEGDSLRHLLDDYELDIKYYRNPRKGMAQNTNEGIKRATGKLIKILYMDDYLYNVNSVWDIVSNFNAEDNWLVTGCLHTDDGFNLVNPHYALYNTQIHLGVNTIGSPSVLTIRNDDPILFDEKMTWLLDCDYYKRLYERYGLPKILDKINVVMGIGEHQATNILSDEIKSGEETYIKQKYDTRT